VLVTFHLVTAPGSCITSGTGIEKLASAKIFQQPAYITRIHGSITVQVSVAGIQISARVIPEASPKIHKKIINIISRYAAITVKVCLTITGIAYSITQWGIGVFLIHATKTPDTAETIICTN
jgi:hypothetical protein